MGTGKTEILSPMQFLYYCKYSDKNDTNNNVQTYVTKSQLLKSCFTIFINRLIHCVCNMKIYYNNIKENYIYDIKYKNILIIDDICLKKAFLKYKKNNQAENQTKYLLDEYEDMFNVKT